MDVVVIYKFVCSLWCPRTH